MIRPIAHRINNLELSDALPCSVGIEFDVHAYGKELIVAHDPHIHGVNFKKFIGLNKNRFCAINIKEEGIEKEVIDLSIDLGLENFFIFDVNFPQILKLGSIYKNYLCLRVSEFEKPKLSELRDFCSNLWIDTFSGQFWMSEDELNYVKDLKYNLCFVSPELHKPNVAHQLKFAKTLKQNIKFLDSNDRVCTKDYKIYSAHW